LAVVRGAEFVVLRAWFVSAAVLEGSVACMV
jgi:hypothetical protein